MDDVYKFLIADAVPFIENPEIALFTVNNERNSSRDTVWIWQKSKEKNKIEKNNRQNRVNNQT